MGEPVQDPAKVPPFLQEKMMQRCGESHPQGLRALLGLQLPEQNGKSADEVLWTRVLVPPPPPGDLTT